MQDNFEFEVLNMTGTQHMAIQIVTHRLSLTTRGHTHIIDITPQVQGSINRAGLQQGNATIFAIGSTAGVTTVEFEPGLVETDLPALFEKFAPYGRGYAHNNTWGDDNGAAHLRSSLLGSSLVTPFSDGRLVLGTWQQVIFVDFDTRPRRREVVVQLIGE